MNAEDYHKSVADYYDEEAETFEGRAQQNHVLGTLRNRFRDVVLEGEVGHLLEIGYGPGLDMVWFVKQPDVAKVSGLDITSEFFKIVKTKAESHANMEPHLGGPEQALEFIGEGTVDAVYVFFGALNTTADLERAVEGMAAVLKPGGRIVATFVNKWYAFDILWNVMTLRPKKAFARLRKVWGGYSPTRYLASRCYSSREVHAAFGKHLKRTRRMGFCITHPAWYRHHWAPSGGLRSRLLFAFDSLLQWTPAWNAGEYTLYVYEKPR
tara:strand:+ start:312 stop:1112 length:801 start_codon:yes stop_codon:yes gene_type:complete